MNYDTILLTKEEFRRLEELEKYPNGLPESPCDYNLVNLRLVAHQFYRNEDRTSAGFHSWITDEGRTYLKYTHRQVRERRSDRLHDWIIAVFSILAGALLSRPIWESIDWLVQLLHKVL